MISVKQLGYVGINTIELDTLEHIMGPVCGTEVRRADANTLYCRVDDRDHRIAYYKADRPSLAYLGLEVDTMDALESAAEELMAKDIRVTWASAEELRERAVMAMFHLSGPDGERVELFFGPVLNRLPFTPGRAISGFYTDQLGLGHAVLHCRDRERSARFYTEVLGFRLSDYIYWSEVEATFLHCNPRHHSLALMNTCFGSSPGQLNHIMLQLKSMDDVGRAYDLVQQQGIPMVMTLGRHTNDNMTSFYIKTPSGFAIEYGYGGVEIDDDRWQVKFFDAPQLWGHSLVTA